ncbi:hypothetical protein H4F18_17730 [Vibrio scophthalmi]|uniref:hypothetical protein n=1 Tax=Vibrio scophthalmi TaxID=45658 RepID=UPI002FEF9834
MTLYPWVWVDSSCQDPPDNDRRETIHSQSYHQIDDPAIIAPLWINVWVKMGQGVMISPIMAEIL